MVMREFKEEELSEEIMNQTPEPEPEPDPDPDPNPGDPGDD